MCPTGICLGLGVCKYRENTEKSWEAKVYAVHTRWLHGALGVGELHTGGGGGGECIESLCS